MDKVGSRDRLISVHLHVSFGEGRYSGPHTRVFLRSVFCSLHPSSLSPVVLPQPQFDVNETGKRDFSYERIVGKVYIYVGSCYLRLTTEVIIRWFGTNFDK